MHANHSVYIHYIVLVRMHYVCVCSIHDNEVASTELCFTAECVMANILKFLSIRRINCEVSV